MVIYRTPDGKAAFQQVDDLPAAVAFVEKIRNEAGVENGRIYRLEQVQYRFEPYYQVRIETGDGPAATGAGAGSAGAGAPASGATFGSPPATADTGAAPESEPVGAAAGAPGSAAAGGSVIGTAPPEAGAPSQVADERQASSGDAGNGVRRGLFGR
jgi:hypothetical protein